MLRTAVLAAARSPLVRKVVESGPFDPLVGRFVAGTGDDAAVAAVRGLATDRYITVDHLGEDTTDRTHADGIVAAYLRLLIRLADEGLAHRTEVSVKLCARAAAPGRRRQGRPRRGQADLRRGRGGRHHRDRRHGGPHHHRPHPADGA